MVFRDLQEGIPFIGRGNESRGIVGEVDHQGPCAGLNVISEEIEIQGPAAVDHLDGPVGDPYTGGIGHFVQGLVRGPGDQGMISLFQHGLEAEKNPLRGCENEDVVSVQPVI